MIEGDNLEVLKLLQKSYAGKVKMVYIDPPYNTGKDFVYPDDFRDNIRNYLEVTGQLGGGGKISSKSGVFRTFSHAVALYDLSEIETRALSFKRRRGYIC